MKPLYDENNWQETTDGNFSVDVSKYTGEKVFIIWAKVVCNGVTTYNEAEYTMKGTKKESVEDTGSEPNKTEVTTDEQEQTVDAPSQGKPDEIPNTGTSYTLVYILGGAIIVSFVLYRRKKNLRF